MTTLKERLKAKQLREELATIEGEMVLVRAVTRSVASQFFADSRNKKGELNAVKAENKLLGACVLDPDSKQPVMDERDWNEVAPHVSRPLVAVVMRVCGLDASDIPDPKDSDSTPS